MTHTDRSVPETKGVDVASASIRPEPWQDIATAPKDGTVILIRISGGMPRVEAAFWNLNSGAQPDPEYPWTTLDGVHGTNGYGDDRPDAWMPLPPCEGSQANLADANKNARELAEAREEIERLRGALLIVRPVIAGLIEAQYNVETWGLKGRLAKLDSEIRRDRVCEVCGGDCSAANPPVIFCPERDAQSALENGKAGLADANPKDHLTLSRDEALSALRAKEELARKLSDALLNVRPLGGSELFMRVGEDFYADPAVCRAEIESLRRELHETKVALFKERRARSVIAQEGDGR